MASGAGFRVAVVTMLAGDFLLLRLPAGRDAVGGVTIALRG
jgi:hypothetical protein